MIHTFYQRCGATLCRAAARPALWLVVGLLSAACVSPGSGKPAPEATQVDTTFADEYRIGVGDDLRVEVWRNDDLSTSVPVRPDGKISVPLAGDVLVGGKTPEEVAAELTTRLATYIRDPYVTVIVTEMGSDQFRSRVRVTGAVIRQVSLPYRQGMTVLDLVLEAGGVNEYASPNRTVLYRRDGERLKISLGRILHRGDMSTNVPLRPGDVITIPERLF